MVGMVGGASRTGNDGRWWEVVWERWEVMGGGGSSGSGGRWWERWEGVGDSPRTPEGGQAASGGASNW